MVESRSYTSPEWSLQEALFGKRNRKYDMASVDEAILGYSGPDNPPYTVPDFLPAEFELRDVIFTLPWFIIKACCFTPKNKFDA